MPSRSVAAREAEQSLRVYAWYLPLSRIYFFTPVYFLFFLERFTLEQVLLLGSIYYVSVVGFELPSGYLSDRIGRVAALRLSAATMSAAYALFLLGGDRFAWFVAAQVLLGMGFASISGTDTAYHYDALHAAGRAGEFGARETRLTRNGYWASAAGAVLAGVVAQGDLAWAYALCLANALGLLALSAALREPARDADGFASGPLVEQARAIGRALREPFLAWLFAFGVVSVSLAHLPAEFAQPYLAAVLGEDVRDVARTPLAAGWLVGLNTGVAALAAGASLRLRRRLGLERALLGVMAWQVVLLVAMAAVVHPLVAVGLLTRSCLPAITRVIVGVEVAPRLPARLRATYLSLDSLAGRLGYALVLAGLAGVSGEAGATADAAGLRTVLQVSAVLGAVGWLGLVATRRAVARPPGPPG